MATSALSYSSKSREFEPGQVMGAALEGGVAGGLANALLFGVGSALGVEFVGKFLPGTDAFPLTVSIVVLASSVLGLLAGAVLVVLNALLARPTAVFIRLAAGVLLFSFIGPVILQEAAVSTKMMLLIMQLVAAVAIVATLLRSAGSTPARVVHA